MGSSVPERQGVTAGNGGGGWCPETEAERTAIHEQLERVLGSHLFSSSKRYPSLLKYIVEETLAGNAGQLKERTLGVDVFGRTPSYDTNLDPVVRTSAAQVRQRVAQYYLEPSHDSEIRIELLPGSYVPVFRHPSSIGHTLVSDPAEVSGETVAVRQEEPERAVPSRRLRSVPYALATGVLALAAVSSLVFTRWAASDPVAKFWGPVWDKVNPIVICVPGKFPAADSVAAQTPAGASVKPLSIIDSLRLNSIAYPDATTLYTLVGFIQARGQRVHVRRAGDTALSDLRTGPAILIGGFNNPWLMRLTSRYRFTYVNDASRREGSIRDAQSPSKNDWKVGWDSPYSSFDEDFGVVSRVWDATTERVVVVASGIASYGTIAAGEFLTNPDHLATIAQRAPEGWERKSLQVVFATKVFNGNAGPPRIIAIHVW